MNNYFVVQITKEKNTEVFATQVTPMDTEREAEMVWHQTMASVLANENIEYANVYVEDFLGNKKWSRVIKVTPEPEEE